jgi:BirA family biotin operon repressor/biotin-[acetyl-CoA-carboxylase] ligase
MPALPLVRDVRPRLRTERFGRLIEGYTSIDSTNARAAAWADDGAPEGSVVVAEHQTAGRGRHGRTWMAAAHQNLMFSVVLRPALPAERIGLIAIASAVAVADVLEGFAAPLLPTVKWPNDVLLRGQKCCGMLLESSFGGRQRTSPAFVVLGVGLNVNQNRFPPELSDRAISIKQAARRPIDRAALFADLLRRLEQRYQSLAEDGGRAVRADYATRLHRLNQRVALRMMETGTPVRGVVRGIDATGALRLETNGRVQTFHAGEVTSR